jgi:aspartate-semialdehyde dehydrogenase
MPDMIKNLAIIGATGAVGQEALAILAQKSLKIENLTLLASKKSVGKEFAYGAQTIVVTELTASSFADVDFAIFSAGGEQSRRFAPIAVEAGCVVIDNSSAFRMDPAVPLVIPEINPEAAKNHKGIIANPNCSTIIMNMATWPLHRVNPIRRMVVSTYQAVSGAGAAAMAELKAQSADVLAGREATPSVLPVQCAFNVFSHNTPIAADGYNTEERKMIDETHKIFAATAPNPNPDSDSDHQIAITATCIRVPVFRAHSESINLTFTNPITPDEVREILNSANGVTLMDDRTNSHFPMPIDASGKDDVLVGRIRQDVSQPDGCGIEMFISGDQLRKGAALNAIQILELVAN